MRKLKITARASGTSVAMTDVADAPGRDPLVASMDPEGQTSSDWDRLIAELNRVMSRKSLMRAYARMSGG